MQNFRLFARKHLKKAACVALAATMAVSVVSASAFAASSPFPTPTTTMTVDSDILTTVSQRAASEIPLVFGLNVRAGNLFTGYLNMGGTSVSTSPDPYVWNYNYDSSGSSTVTYQLASGSISNANGLYNSGGGNQCYIADSVNYGVNLTTLSDANSTYAAIVTYYTSSKSNPIPSDTTGYGAYNYGYDLETLLQNYYDHMTEHVWAPLTNVVGTYGYGITASTVIA